MKKKVPRKIFIYFPSQIFMCDPFLWPLSFWPGLLLDLLPFHFDFISTLDSVLLLRFSIFLYSPVFLLIIIWCTWVVVIGPKPARIRGTVLFYPFFLWVQKPWLGCNNSFLLVFCCLLLSFPFLITNIITILILSQF